MKSRRRRDRERKAATYGRQAPEICSRSRERYLQNRARLSQERANHYLAKNFGRPRKGRRPDRRKRLYVPGGRGANERARYHTDNHRVGNAMERIRHILDMGGKCACCGETTWWHLTIDHIVPISSGGTDHPGNLQVLCHACNTSKGNRLECRIPHGLLIPEDKR